MYFPQFGHVCVESALESEHRKHGAHSQNPRIQQIAHINHPESEGLFDTAVVIWKKERWIKPRPS